MAECPLCGANLELNKNTEKGELLECHECGTELEVTGTNPFTLTEAPKEEEDWGE